MEYQNDLLKRLDELAYWPDFDNSSNLSELNGIAEDAFLYKTTYSYLSAVLIYQQLCEEVLRLLIHDAEFFIQLSIYPTEIKFSAGKKTMFGQLIDKLEATVEFKHKAATIDKADKLNKVRIEIVHGLTKTKNLPDKVEVLATKVRTLFEELFQEFSEAHSWFFRRFHEFRKRLCSQEARPKNLKDQ